MAALLREVGLPPHAVELYPHEFSGGQRQRIGLARALALNPRLIVTDEPVSALDVSIRSQILNLMKRLQVNHGLSYVFISHDLSVVRYLADRIAVMYLGKLVEIGSGDDIYARPAHPYTAGLIASIPVPNPSVQRSPDGHPDPRRAAVAAQPALGLPVPHPVPQSPGQVCRRGAGAQPVRRRAFRRLLLPAPGASEGSSGGYASRLRAHTPAWSAGAAGPLASAVDARPPRGRPLADAGAGLARIEPLADAGRLSASYAGQLPRCPPLAPATRPPRQFYPGSENWSAL